MSKPKSSLFTLVGWPAVQDLMGRRGFRKQCRLVAPFGNPALDSTWLVPDGFAGVKASPKDSFEEVPWPDAQSYMFDPEALSDYDGRCYIPAAV